MLLKQRNQCHYERGQQQQLLQRWLLLVLLLLMFLTLHVTCSHGVAMSVPISVVASRRTNAAGAKKTITASGSGRSTGLFVAAEAADTASKGIERNSKEKARVTGRVCS